MTDLIGAIAATLTTVSFVPQVWQIWASKSAKDISLPMYLLFTTGVVLWLIYGIRLNAMPIIAANVVTLVLLCAVIGMKLHFESTKR